MARFLSPEWFTEVTRAEPPGTTPPVAVLEQVVEGTPDGAVTYRIEVAGGRGRIVWPVPEPAGRPDLRFTSDWTTAVAIARGELSAQRALMLGRVRVSGNPGRLAELAGDLEGADPIPDSVRRATIYPSSS